MKITVGHPHRDYPYERNIVNILDDVHYIKVRDIFTALNDWAPRINAKLQRNVLQTKDYKFQFNDFDLNKVDLLHFFNTISYGRTPWITTFETTIPRFLRENFERGYDQKVKNALKQITGRACKRIIAMSQCNAQKQRDFVKNYSQYEEGVNKKLLVVPPPQELFLKFYSDKNLGADGAIRFMLVGASFFRKGGMEIIETFKKIREQFNYPLELTIVSALAIDNYATKEGPEDVEKARNIIEQNSSWIRWHPKLKNDKVVELMRSSHVGLLPTYADTYGFSVLEFQAAGCPCITTNIRALSEINNCGAGWVIDVPKQQSGEAIYATNEDRNVISKSIRDGLEKAIHEIFADRSIIIKKAERSISRIKEHHSVERYAAKMKDIYQEALSRRD